MSDTQFQKKKNKQPLNNYARYSGIAFQMGIIIFAGTFGGIKLDKIIKWDFPVFTVTLSLVSVFAAIYVVIKDLNNTK